MISVMNNHGCEFGRGSDLIDEPRTDARVPGDDVAVSSGRVLGRVADVDKCADFTGSCETWNSPPLCNTTNVADSSVRVLEGHSGMHLAAFKSENRRSEGVVSFLEANVRGYDIKMDHGVMQRQVDAVASVEAAQQYGGRAGSMDEKEEDKSMEWRDRKEQLNPQNKSDKSAVSSCEIVPSNFDHYTGANEGPGVMDSRVSYSVGHGFEIGDMVWGKVKSHPWWPGHIFCEAFATSAVRRSRREGHVLAAFFGDNSYGWFDPAELIHFDSYYAEKSRQVFSRNFTKAVEEAVDEVRRRAGLGLACRCRNPYNFRQTKVKGYFAVDVPDYEPAVIYSASQIRKARDRFHPGATLSLLKQLALAPQSGDQMSIDRIKGRATILAYRKAVYEEFDETYAQAFGMQAVRPLQTHGASNLHPQQPSQAPLSGPLVFAEALSGRKTSGKASKVKNHAKKDRYLFKRRDEQSNSKIQEHNKSFPQLVFADKTASVTGDYVLQKSDPPSVKHDQDEDSSEVDATVSTQDTGVKVGINIDPRPITTDSQVSVSKVDSFTNSPVCRPTSRSFPDMEKTSLDKASFTVQDLERVGPFTDVNSISSAGSEFSDAQTHSGSVNTLQEAFQLQDDSENKNAQALQPSVAEECEGSQNDSLNASPSAPTDEEASDKALDSGISAIKEKRSKLKRSSDDLDSGKPISREKKKKKKKAIDLQSGSVRPRKQSAAGKDGSIIGKPSRKSTKDDDSVGAVPQAGTEPVAFQQVIADLLSLALDPSFIMERNSLGISRQCILRFRSLVYQKSLVSSPPAEAEPSEINSLKPSAVPVGEKWPQKPASRSEDPTRAGVKRAPSDRQEEIAAKKLKKINHVKSLAAEKKANLKAERKESPLPLSAAKLNKEVPVKSESPTMLIMKLPPHTSLPSPMELRARFARFGQLDHSSTRVFWKTCTCRVVFKYKADAEAALKYATGSNSLFGNVSVHCSLREVEAPAAEVQDSGKANAGEAQPRVTPPQPSVQLKSCLKKSGEESGQRGTPRVKFLLGGVAMDVNSSKNVVGAAQTLKPVNVTAGVRGVDISQPMIELLRQCNDVVGHLRAVLGRVPYQPL